MIFKTEEEQKDFHASNATLQLLVHIFEGFCFELSEQVHFLHLATPNQVVVGCRLSHAGMLSVENKMNEQFKRHDEQKTCEIVYPEHGLFHIYGDSIKSFSTLA